MSHYDFMLGGSNGGQGKSRGQQHTALAIEGVTNSMDNFSLCSTPHKPASLPPLPVLPPKYIPSHTPFKRKFSSKPHEVAGMGRHDIDHHDRGRILEGAKVAPPFSTPPPIATAIIPPVEDVTPTNVEEETSEEPSTTSKSGSFKPFALDAKKQGRYDLYLRMKEKGMKGQFADSDQFLKKIFARYII